MMKSNYIILLVCILFGLQSPIAAQSSDWVYSPYAQYLTNDTTIPPPVGEPADAALSCFRHDTIYVLVMPTGQLYIWLRPDPLLDKYIQSSPYAYCDGNPLKYVDPEGLSTHTNEDGLVVAVYDDNDLNIYKHSNAKLSSWGDVYENHLTTDDAEIMGQSLHPMSFADQDIYNETREVTHAKGMTIDFGSTALGDAIQNVVDSKPSLWKYGLNARSKHVWDFKEQAQYKNRGSQISNGIYLSPRDAGNVLAGAIKRQSGLLAPFVQFGYGAYNLTNNNILGTAILSIGMAVLMTKNPMLGIPTTIVIMNGEDKLTQLSIDLGYKYYGGK